MTDLDLANTALNMIAQDQIVSLENTVNSKTIATVNRFLPLAKAETLKPRDWNAVRGRKTLAAVANNSLGDWAAAYQLPADFLHFRRFVAPQDEVRHAPYEISGKTLYTNWGTNAIVYTRNVMNPNEWDAPLFHTAATRLAWHLTGPLVRDVKLQQYYSEKYDKEFKDTVGVDESEGGINRVYSNSLVNVRF